MIYTFQKRKELNDMAIKRYAGTSFEIQTGGAPRMRCAQLPTVAEEIGSVGFLERNAYLYWKQTKRQLPVFIAMHSKCGLPSYYEVNYVSHLSDKSLNAAGAYIGEHRLFSEVMQTE